MRIPEEADGMEDLDNLPLASDFKAEDYNYLKPVCMSAEIELRRW